MNNGKQRDFSYWQLLDIINAKLDETQLAYNRLRHQTGESDRPARSCQDLMTYSLNTNLTNGDFFFFVFLADFAGVG